MSDPSEPDRTSGLPDDFKWGDLPPGFGPDGPLPSMNTEAAAIHEVYSSNLAAGFRPNQALYLTAVVITNNPGTAPDAPPPDLD